jgi:tight adherence protein B
MALTPVVVVSAIGFGIGAVALVFFFSGERIAQAPGRRNQHLTSEMVTRRLLPPVAAGLLVLALTRWPVAGLLAGFLVAFIPRMVGLTSAQVSAGRVEAVAAWTELLRDTLAASTGLSEAIMATAPVSPPAIRGQVMHLADRLASGLGLSEALRHFAAEVDDPSCDMVVCALLLAASARAQKLTDLLGALADSIRQEVGMRLRVETSRVASKSSVRTIVAFSLLFGAILMVVARSYLAPLGTPEGQLVLAVVGGCYATGVALMLRLVRPPRRTRLLSGVDAGDTKW